MIEHRTMAEVLRTVRNAEELQGILDAILAPDVETKPVTPEDWDKIRDLQHRFERHT